MTNQTVTLIPTPMTAESFAPYGEILYPNEHPADRRTTTLSGFQCDGQVRISTMWQPARELSFTRLERHYGVTQTFFQLSGAPSVVCAALPTSIDDASAIPAPDDIRAFLIDPKQGWAFHIGTWHSLDRYVLEPPGATFAMINVDPNPTQVVNYQTGESVIFRDLDIGEPAREAAAHPHRVRFEIKGQQRAVTG
ncbi:MAG: hypothetical protein HOI95_12480 [Chromatiales bacterium]|jgi:ureidoglycolate lyase|nr:hypothetical protein [Chromatiales bacterium]